jgi:hypothetical protein
MMTDEWKGSNDSFASVDEMTMIPEDSDHHHPMSSSGSFLLSSPGFNCRTPKVEYFPSPSTRTKRTNEPELITNRMKGSCHSVGDDFPNRVSAASYFEFERSCLFSSPGDRSSERRAVASYLVNAALSAHSHQEQNHPSSTTIDQSCYDWRAVTADDAIHVDAHGRAFHRSSVRSLLK